LTRSDAKDYPGEASNTNKGVDWVEGLKYISGGAMWHADKGVENKLGRDDDWGKEVEDHGDDGQEWREKRAEDRAKNTGDIGDHNEPRREDRGKKWK